ncbi:unnamed protein product [Cuscuta epithymum]|uniref:Uncharacterized protein n=1 Tax=Cuscuta epithymum TaxID=186058 RepID=A0AAV0CJW2_9ASTE|nr:unnamed protein product [Cuscuta epithymum]
MNSHTSKLIELLLITYSFSFLRIINAQSYDFFYFVQQWPGSYCDTKQSCCYPTTGKPKSDFGIHGLWPNMNDGSYPSNCDSTNPYDDSKISDLLSRMHQDWPTLACPSNSGSTFWSHEWEKHGTCSESVLTQRSYFQTTLNLKSQIDLLHVLQSAGIQPDGSSYSLADIKQAIRDGIGYDAWIECNSDADGERQLYQVYVCVDSSASTLIKCPVFPHGSCASTIKFPSF